MDTNKQVGSTPYYGEEESIFTKLKNHLIELIEFVAIVGAIVVVIHFFVAEPHKVSGKSMFPTFHDGDYLITNKLHTRFSQIKRGEVIIFENPKNKEQDFIKRVLGLPNDKIKIQGGQLFINGKLVDESYLPKDTQTFVESFMDEGEEITVSENSYFVIGDNRGGSSDSREFGPVPKELIVGQAWIRYWPPKQFGLIKNFYPKLN